MNVEELFTTMVEKRASHLHLVPGSPIVMRQQKKLSPLNNQVLSPQDTSSVASAILTEEQFTLLDQHLEVDFTFSVPGLSRFHISAFYQRGSIALVISTNPPAPPTVEDLVLPELLTSLVLEAESGLILLTGPKGSGKSHTLAALVSKLLEEKNILMVTLERPIEFLHKNRKGIICQREIGSDAQSFDEAFDGLVHQEPDIVVVTGLADHTVMSRVIELAAGGSLVLCTAASPNSTVMLERIVDQYPPHLHQQARTLLSVALKVVVSQTLCSRSDEEGLIAAYEVLLGTPQVKTLIQEGKIGQLAGIMATSGREQGMMSQEMALRGLVRRKLITEEEAYKHAVSPEQLRKLMAMPY